MLKKVKLPIALSASVFVSGCSLESYIDQIKDYLYLLDPPLRSSNVCENFHYHKANTLPEEFHNALSGKVAFLYWFGSEESKNADIALNRLGDYFSQSDIPTIRFPAINNAGWTESAHWSLALSSMGLDKNRDLISLSYEYFANNISVDEFNHHIMSIGKSPHLFHELKMSAQHSDEVVRLGDMTFLPGTEKIPAIIVDASFIVYPSDFNDMRDAWMTASYIFNNDDDLSIQCQK